MLELNPIDGSAVAGDDFATSFEFSDDFGATWQAAGGANGSEVTIAAGNTSLLVRHAAVDDSAEEPIETFELSANVISGAVGTVTPGTAMIGDDDVVVTLNDASVDEGGQLVFTMDLTYATTKQIRLNVVPGDDTATGPDDFETSGFEYSFNNGAVWFNAFGPNADLVAFNPGQTSILVRIDTVDDAIFEGDETFTLSAESDTNNNGPIVDAVATIIDNDPPPAPTTPGNGFLDAVYSDYGREDDDEGSERDSHLPDWLW